MTKQPQPWDTEKVMLAYCDAIGLVEALDADHQGDAYREELSRLMGTSPAMLDKTYGHMLPDALDRARSALDAFVWARSGHSSEAAEE